MSTEAKQAEPEVETLTLGARQAAHRARHPNDENRRRSDKGVHWVSLRKKANQHIAARLNALDEFYETHTWTGFFASGWVPKDTTEEEE